MEFEINKETLEPQMIKRLEFGLQIYSKLNSKEKNKFKVDARKENEKLNNYEPEEALKNVYGIFIANAYLVALDKFVAKSNAPHLEYRERPIRYMNYATFTALGLGIISILILMLPSIVEAKLTNQSLYQTIRMDLNPYVLLFPFWVFLVMTVSYNLYMKLSKRDRKYSYYYGLINTILFALLPCVVYAVVYFIFYSIR